MFIFGITGGTGVGKTTAVKVLQTLGVYAIDCDDVYHEVLLSNANMKEEIIANFGDVATDGEVDRKKLGKIVWNDPGLLQKLNTITFKYMDSEIDKRLESLQLQDVEIVVIDAVALIESGQDAKCDVVIGITAPKEKRLSRIKSRDNITEDHALKRINAQQPKEFYWEHCKYILENIYDTEVEFEDRCKSFFQELIAQRVPF